MALAHAIVALPSEMPRQLQLGYIRQEPDAPPPLPLVNRNSATPPLKWAGGKRWLLPHLAPIWQHYQDRRLIEPFCGGLAVALGLSPKRALLNDINPHLVNFYRWIQRGLRIDFKMENSEQSFYRSRERFNRLIAAGTDDSAEAAGLFYYLNRTGYNGLCRFNQKGFFNVPFGRYTTISYRRDFSVLAERLADWKFSNCAFNEIKLAPLDFVYADPPYDVDFTTYSSGGFTWEDQQKTAEWLASHSGPVILSNQATARIVKLYKSLGYKIEYLQAPRRIACNGDRKPAKEVVAMRNIEP